jgi:hypothetical protein
MENDEISAEDRAEIKRLAEIALRNTELLIQACDNWLPAEVGNKEMAKRYWERQKIKRRRRWRKALRCLGITLKYSKLEDKFDYSVSGVRYERWID